MTFRPKQIALLIALATIAIVAVLVIRMVDDLLEAETRSRTALNTCRIVAEYISTSNEPRWPTSWDDLAHLTLTEVDPYWPDDRAAYETYVAIDFDTDLQQVAQLTFETFDVIQPIGDNTGFHDYGYRLVIDAAKAAVEP